MIADDRANGTPKPDGSGTWGTSGSASVTISGAGFTADIGNPHGFLFNRCALTSDAPAGRVYLGRPWHPGNDPNAIGQTVIRQSAIGAHIGATAWSNFGDWPWADARFAEYHNYGPGALRSPDRPQLTDRQAPDYTPAAFLGDWSPYR